MVAPDATVLAPDTVTVASTGAGLVTVITAVPVLVVPLDVAVAVMVEVPAATAVTIPVALTVATLVADELHVTVDAIGAPFWSLVVAESVALPPATMACVDGVTVTVVSTGGTPDAVTVIWTVLVTVAAPASADAVIVAVPAPTPVTRPVVALTVAIAAEEVLHVTAATIAVPLWSFGAATSCTVDPDTMLVDGAEMVTDVSTGAGAATVTVIVAVTLLLPELAVAVMVAVPAATALTRPVPLTVATEPADDVHETVAATAIPF